jgi:hypothetical protein
MPAFPYRLRAAAVAVSAIALLAVAAGGTFAASNPPTLYACFDVNGNVRLSDKNMCQLPAGGRLVSFNTVGIQGPTGPIGTTGPAGATGPNAITAGTACTTATYTATIGFDDHGYPHCGVLLTVALGQGGLEGMTASTFTASVNYIVFSGIRNDGGVHLCGWLSNYTDLPCAAVISPSVPGAVVVSRLHADGSFHLRCANGTPVTATDDGSTFTAICPGTIASDGTVTILP